MHLVRNEGGSWPPRDEKPWSLRNATKTALSIMDVARHAGYSVHADRYGCDCGVVFDSLALLELHRATTHVDGLLSDQEAIEMLEVVAEDAVLTDVDVVLSVEGVSSSFLAAIDAKARRTPPANIPFKLVQLSRHVAVKFVLGDEEWSE
jgi:hypothetical protein